MVAGEEGTNELRKTYLKDTPGQTENYEVASFSAAKPMVDEADENKETGKSQRTFELVRRALSGKKSMCEEFIAGIPDAPTAAELGMTVESGFNFDPETEEEMLGFTEEEFEVTGDEQYEDWGEQLDITEAEYQGRKVQLGKPFRTPGGPKKTAVYVMGPKGNVVKVNFGDPNMTIKKNIPARRKSFRARHHCDTNPGPCWKARYWSCKAW